MKPSDLRKGGVRSVAAHLPADRRAEEDHAVGVGVGPRRVDRRGPAEVAVVGVVRILVQRQLRYFISSPTRGRLMTA